MFPYTAGLPFIKKLVAIISALPLVISISKSSNGLAWLLLSALRISSDLCHKVGKTHLDTALGYFGRTTRLEGSLYHRGRPFAAAGHSSEAETVKGNFATAGEHLSTAAL
jgi:hypothetical protein